MGVLRDIVARYAIHVDEKPLTDLDRRINRLNDKFKRTAQLAAVGFGVAAAGAFKLVEAASAAEESLNVLRETFKDNKESVITWSRDLAKALGRSEFTLQESVGRFGAFLAPVFKDANVDIAQMSQQLSELAVDLASFYNTSDAEAIMRLFSGISGETEAVRRLGINISDSALAELAKKQGDTRDYNVLTLAEKTALRFKKILIDTENVQGDAIRTAGEWANSLKRVQEKMKTFAVVLGRVLKKFALPMLHSFEKTAEVVQKLFLFVVKRSSAFETAFWLAASAAAALALKTAAAAIAADGLFIAITGIVAVVRLLQGALAAGVFLVIEDIVTFMRDGDSILGSWLTSITGLSRPLGLVEAVFEKISIHAHNTGVRLKQAVQYAMATSMLAAGNPTGAQAALADAEATGKRTLSWEDVQAKRQHERESNFQSAVMSGGYKGLKEAATQFGDPRKRADDEYRRAFKMREDMLKKGLVQPDADDMATFPWLKTRAPLKSPIPEYRPVPKPPKPPTSVLETPAATGLQPITPGLGVHVPFMPNNRVHPTYGSVTLGEPKLVVQKLEVNVRSEADAEKAGRAFAHGLLELADQHAGERAPEAGDEDLLEIDWRLPVAP